MRNEATSAMTATSHAAMASDTAALRQTVIGGPAVRDISLPEASTSTVITAEFPAVRAENPGYGVLLPDGTVWYPGSKKKLPAPLTLRVAVWVLAFATLIAAVGVIVIRLHPSWFNPLRHVNSASAPAVGAGTGSHTGSRSPSGSAGSSTSPSGSALSNLSKMNPQPSGLPSGTTAYSVPASSYSVAITANHLTWVGIYPVVNGQEASSPTQQTEIQAGQTQTWQEHGTVVVHLGASLVTMKVLSGNTTLGTISQALSGDYWLQPNSNG